MADAALPMVDLGGSGLRVPAVGLGCMGMSDLYGPVDREAALGVLRRALDLGPVFADSSDAYGFGANEELIAEFLADAPRDQVTVGTKFGSVRDPATLLPTRIRGDAEYVRRACEASLRRLGTDHIDIYSPHFPDPDTPIEDTVAAIAKLVSAGKVGHIGLSNVTAAQVRAAAAEHPIVAVETEWSLFTREAESELVGTCAELGIGIVPYAPLHRGFLTGAITSAAVLPAGDFRRNVPRFNGADAQHNAGLLEPLRQIAVRHGATMAQIALAWLLHWPAQRGVGVVPIPGTTSVAHLEENRAAAALALSADDLALLEPLAGQVHGSAWPPLPPEMRKIFGRQAWTEG